MKGWRNAVFVGWGLFMIAFFLPVHEHGSTLADGVLPGWEALTAALFEAGIFGAASALSNLLMLATLFVLWAKTRQTVMILFVLTAASTLLNGWWFVGTDDRGDLMIGYYLWCTSFGVVAGGLFARARHVAGLERQSAVAAA